MQLYIFLKVTVQFCKTGYERSLQSNYELMKSLVNFRGNQLPCPSVFYINYLLIIDIRYVFFLNIEISSGSYRYDNLHDSSDLCRYSFIYMFIIPPRRCSIFNIIRFYEVPSISALNLIFQVTKSWLARLFSKLGSALWAPTGAYLVSVGLSIRGPADWAGPLRTAILD